MSRPGLIKVRCAPATNTPYGLLGTLNVDREAGIIYNVAIMQANVEALGHGVMSDYTTLQQCVVLGNQPARGIQGHLGHPGMSENSSGTQFFTSRNFRIGEDRLLADLHMFEPSRRSPRFTYDAVEWMMDMAEQHPDQLAMSAVIGMHAVWVMEDGSEEDAYVDDFGDSEEPPYGATTPLPVIRVEAFYNADVVEEGALTHAGLFSADTPAYYSDELFVFLDEWRAKFKVPLEDVPKKAHQFASKYVNSRKRDDMKGKNSFSKPTSSTQMRGANPKDNTAKLEEGIETPPVADAGAPAPVADTTPEPDPIASAEAGLAEAEALLADVPEDDDEQEGEDQGTQEGEPEQSLAARVRSLEENRETLYETISALARLVDGQMKVISKLTKRVMALENEDVITEKIGGVRTLAATRSAIGKLTRPHHTSERYGDPEGTPVNADFENDAEQATLAVVLQNQRALR